MGDVTQQVKFLFSLPFIIVGSTIKSIVINFLNTLQLYAVAVRLTLPDGSKAEGVGLATAEITNVELKFKAIAYAKKCAMASALKNAFSKVRVSYSYFVVNRLMLKNFYVSR